MVIFTSPNTLGLQNIADVQFPNADKIILLQDNLKTHRPAALHEAVSP